MYQLKQATNNDIHKIEEVLLQKVTELKNVGIIQWSKEDISWNKLQTVSKAEDYYFVYEHDEIIGLFCVVDVDKVYWPNDKPKSTLYIHKVTVLDKARGKGVSTFMLDAFKDMGRALNLDKVKLDTRASKHKLRALYEAQGFELLEVVDYGFDDKVALYECKL